MVKTPMRVLAILAATCLMIGIAAIPTSADHGDDFTDSQQILIGTGPLWWEGLGITEVASACNPGGDAQGIDGYWYDLDALGFAGTGHEFLLTTSDPMDIDALFYDEGCNQVSVVGACFVETGLGEADPLGDCQFEQGEIPETAKFLLVQNFLGGGTYQMTLSSP